MTRDEAIEAVRTAVMQQRRENEINLAELLVDALFALGVLKLDDVSVGEMAPILGRDKDALYYLRAIIREQGMEWKEIRPLHFEITSPTSAMQRDLIERYKPISIRIDYAPAIRCEPPPEHRSKRWHWVRDREGILSCAWWLNGFCGTDWQIVGHSHTAGGAYDSGWRYVSPCQMPQESKS